MNDHPTWNSEDERRTREEWLLGEFATPEAEKKRQQQKDVFSAAYGLGSLSLLDVSLSPLAAKTLYPGTADKERYARQQRENVQVERTRFGALRSIAHIAQQDLTVIDIAFDSLLRTISRTDDVDTNRRRIAAALDVLRHVVEPFEWRSRPFVVRDDDTSEEYERTPDLLRYDGHTTICSCRTAPADVCTALIHSDLV